MSCESRIDTCNIGPRNGLCTGAVRPWKECDMVYEIALDDGEEEEDDNDNNNFN